MPGMTNEVTIHINRADSKKPKEMTEDEILEENARKAFKTLAEILNKAREEKNKRMKQEMEQGGLNETSSPNADINTLIENPRSWVIYPESKFSTLWDLNMGM
jgi:hypothetical protein